MEVEAWLARAAAAQPRRTALETPEGSCTYAQLLADAGAGAEQLAARGVRAGERVAIALPAGLDFARALHACLLLGAAAVPVDLRLSPPERTRIAAGSAAVLEQPLQGASEADGERRERGLLRARRARHALDATAVVIHTSGTTSAPKPVELSYGNFLWSALGSAVALGLDPGERWLCALPVSHVGGLSILLRSVVYATTAVVHERFETGRVLRALQEDRITLVSLVATTLARLLDAGLDHPPALRCALTGGGPVPPALLGRARAAGVAVSQTYGLTETCSQVTTVPLAAAAKARGDARRAQRGPAGANSDGEAGRTTSGAGPALFCTRARVGADGEIMVAGPTVAPGSAGRDGWLRTGDLGVFDAHGHLRITGRKADTIVSGGENVAPAEVEAVLETHPAVVEAAVVARADPEWGETVCAIVVLRAGGTVDGETLRVHCATVLAPYKVPKQVTLSREPLPRTSSGKLLRRELR